MASSEVSVIQSQEDLHAALSKTKVLILLITFDGRDAVNASAQEELESTAKTYEDGKRTFARISGDNFRKELKDVGIDLWGTDQYPKFAFFVDGKVNAVDDAACVDLLSELWRLQAL